MASMKQIQGFCPTCNQRRMYAKPGINHVVHALVSVFTCGLWLLVWIIVIIANSSKSYRCQSCGGVPRT